MIFHTLRLLTIACFISAREWSSVDETLEGSGEGSGEEDQVTPDLNFHQDQIPQQLETKQSLPQSKNVEGCGADIVFLLDASGSLEQTYTQHINWTTQLADALLSAQPNVRIGVIQYADNVTTEFSLGTYKDAEDITRHIEGINFRSGGTRTGKALEAAEQELFNEQKGARSNALKTIVLFTDGLSIDDPLKHAQQLREMRHVRIYVVSVGSDGFEPEMDRIAGEKFNVFGPNEVGRLQKSLIEDLKGAQNCTSSRVAPNREQKQSSKKNRSKKRKTKSSTEHAVTFQTETTSTPNETTVNDAESFDDPVSSIQIQEQPRNDLAETKNVERSLQAEQEINEDNLSSTYRTKPIKKPSKKQPHSLRKTSGDITDGGKNAIDSKSAILTTGARLVCCTRLDFSDNSVSLHHPPFSVDLENLTVATIVDKKVHATLTTGE